MAESSVILEVSDRVAKLTLNRPDRLNAFDGEMMGYAGQLVREVEADTSVGALVITGAGRGFCAGGDRNTIAAATAGGSPEIDVARQVREVRVLEEISERLYRMPKLTVAAINGPCAGAGLSIAAACDVRYAARSAVFAAAFLDAGQTGDYGISWTLPRLVGLTRARQLLLTGVRIDADTAENYGLVTAVTEDDELLSYAMGVATSVAAKSSAAFAGLKQNLVDSQVGDLNAALDREAERLIANIAAARAAATR